MIDWGQVLFAVVALGAAALLVGMIEWAAVGELLERQEGESDEDYERRVLTALIGRDP